MLALERRAEAVSAQFNSQGVANTVWALATMGREPEERMMLALERRAEAVSGEFNAQEIANTIWALATMVRKPDERMMLALERRMEQNMTDFSNHNIANVIWAMSYFHIHPPRALVRTAANVADFNDIDMCQLATSARVHHGMPPWQRGAISDILKNNLRCKFHHLDDRTRVHLIGCLFQSTSDEETVEGNI